MLRLQNEKFSFFKSTHCPEHCFPLAVARILWRRVLFLLLTMTCAVPTGSCESKEKQEATESTYLVLVEIYSGHDLS